LSEFYNGSEVGSTPTDQRTHEPQIQLVFDNIKSVEMMEMALATVREMMKRDAEKADNHEQLSPEMKALLSQKVEELDLSVRTRNLLKANGIDTILDLCRLKKTDWLKFRNGGKKSLTELDDFLTAHNLTWGMNV
jgi:DNA-directed RNA polymerase alpha subunit